MRKLDKAGINYDAIDLSKRPDLVEQFKNEGLLSAPIIENQDGRSSGFNPDRIRKIIALADPYTKPASNPGNASNANTPVNTSVETPPQTQNTHTPGQGQSR